MRFKDPLPISTLSQQDFESLLFNSPKLYQSMHGDNLTIWVFEYSKLDPSKIENDLRRHLKDLELSESSHFLSEKRKAEFLLCRLLTRLLLAAAHPGTRLGDWTLLKTKSGRPFLLSPNNEAALLQISISHTDKNIALAINRRADFGIDVEETSLDVEEIDRMSHFLFNTKELNFFTKLSVEQRAEYFYHLWTAKEASTKLLNIPLETAFNQIEIKNQESATFTEGKQEVEIHLASFSSIFKTQIAIASRQQLPSLNVSQIWLEDLTNFANRIDSFS